MPLRQLITDIVSQPFAEGDVVQSPFARRFGFRYRVVHGDLMLILPYRDELIGSPIPARLHGGVIGGLLEYAGLFCVMQKLSQAGELPSGLPKPIGITVDFLREGKPHDTFAAAEVTRLGRRVANVRAEAWQSDRERPIATAVLNVVVDVA